MTVREIGRLLREAGVKFWKDDGPRLGAALAFYTALSLSPLLLAVVAIAGLAFGQEAARGEIVGELRDAIGGEGAAVIEQMVAQSASVSRGVGATVVAFAVLLFGASRVFSELQNALNNIWKVPGRKPGGGVLAIARGRLLAFSLVCGTAFLLLASLVVSAVLSAVSDRIAATVPGMNVAARAADFVLTSVLLTALFAMIFKWLPETTLAWSDVWLGAAVTAGLFSVGKYLIGLYLGTAAVGSAYGAAGAFVVLLVWVYWSAQILLFGAELTFVYARKHGHGVATEAAPQSVSDKEIASAN